MKLIRNILILVVLLITSPVFASEAIKCFEVAYAHKHNGGFGITQGYAVELCSGTSDAKEVLQCFAKAWGHPANNGLGLTIGQAVALCKANSQPLDHLFLH